MDPRTTIEAIRSFVYQDDQTNGPEFQQLVSAYNELVSELNLRISALTELKAKGLYEQAFHESERDPSIDAMIEALSFEEQAEWEGIASLYDAKLAAVDIIGATLERDSLLSTKTSVQVLLKNLRRANLQKNVPAKLNILRQIHRADPENREWIDDIAQHEKTRLSELSTIVNSLAVSDNADNFETLHSLRDEIINTKWIVSPSDEIKQTINNKFSQSLNALLHKQFNSLVEKINNSFNLRDYNTCEDLFSLWETKERSNPEIAHEFAPLVADCREWLVDTRLEKEKEAEFNNLKSLLESHLECAEIDLPEAESIAVRISNLGYSLPENLGSKLQLEINKAEDKIRRASALKIVSIVSAVIVIAGILVLAAMYYKKSSTRATFIAHAKVLDETGKYGDIQALYDELIKKYPAMIQDEDIEEIRSNAVAKANSEKLRLEEFNTGMERLKILSMDDTEYADSIEKIAPLAITAEEKNNLLELKLAFEKHEKQKEVKASKKKRDEFLQSCDEILISLKQLEENLNKEEHESIRDEDLLTYRNLIDNAKDAIKNATAMDTEQDLKRSKLNEVEICLRRISNTFETLIKKASSYTQIRNDITASVGDMERFAILANKLINDGSGSKTTLWLPKALEDTSRLKEFVTIQNILAKRSAKYFSEKDDVSEIKTKLDRLLTDKNYGEDLFGPHVRLLSYFFNYRNELQKAIVDTKFIDKMESYSGIVEVQLEDGTTAQYLKKPRLVGVTIDGQRFNLQSGTIDFMRELLKVWHLREHKRIAESGVEATEKEYMKLFVPSGLAKTMTKHQDFVKKENVFGNEPFSFLNLYFDVACNEKVNHPMVNMLLDYLSNKLNLPNAPPFIDAALIEVPTMYKNKEFEKIEKAKTLAARDIESFKTWLGWTVENFTSRVKWVAILLVLDNGKYRMIGSKIPDNIDVYGFAKSHERLYRFVNIGKIEKYEFIPRSQKINIKNGMILMTIEPMPAINANKLSEKYGVYSDLVKANFPGRIFILDEADTEPKKQAKKQEN